MGLGLTQYLPLIIYIAGIIAAVLSMVVNPLIGVLFLFPLLPYQVIFEKIYAFPLGNNLNDIIIFCIFVGWLLRRKDDKKSGLALPIAGIVLTSIIGLFNALGRFGLNFQSGSNYFADWKNYMLLPLIWFLTLKNIKDKKTLKLFVMLLIIGILGADYYFHNNIKWMNTWHYSNRLRNMMSGLFVYLGANHYGAFFAHFIFIPLGILLFNKSFKIKAALLPVIALTAYCLLYSYSRGAYIAFMAGLLFVGLLKDRRILLGLLVFFLLWRSLVPISVAERIDMTKTESGELEDSAAIRTELWRVAVAWFKESPVIGQGFNTFQYEYNGEVWKDTHNYYLKMLVELGILGLLSFLLILAFAFWKGWALYLESKDTFFKGLGFGFAVCVISVMITNFFGDRWTYLSLGSYFWLFLGAVTRAKLINDSELIKAQNNGKKISGLTNNK